MPCGVSDSEEKFVEAFLIYSNSKLSLIKLSEVKNEEKRSKEI